MYFSSLNYRHTSFYCTALYCAPQLGFFVFFFLQNEGKTLHQQKDCNLLYCHICFIAAVWKKPAKSLRDACMEGQGCADKYDCVSITTANI